MGFRVRLTSFISSLFLLAHDRISLHVYIYIYVCMCWCCNCACICACIYLARGRSIVNAVSLREAREVNLEASLGSTFSVASYMSELRCQLEVQGLKPSRDCTP